MQLFDISPPISERLGVWPGDTTPQREVLLDMKDGANLTLSTLRATVHLGAHADGPNHYGRDARSIDEQPLERYLGPCQVMHVEIKRGERVGPSQLTGEIHAPRLLIATGTFPDPNDWNEDFAALAPELIDHLHERGVELVGIDTPSVDLFSDKELQSHHRFLAHDMAILEGLVLREVPDGLYELIALPLKLVGFDASPVRAVLKSLGSS
ncbi:MAG: kynurenine formamidase [Phycisphaerales bacterium]|nr:MAG: kynurenine formamidase [Phycisphaerales bacterium]